MILTRPSHQEANIMLVSLNMFSSWWQGGVDIIWIWVSEWLLLNANSAISAISWREQINFQWGDDEFRFVLDQHAGLDFYSASSLKQQSEAAGRHVAPIGHIILIRRSNKYQQSLIWPGRGSNPRPTALETSILTITPPMRFHLNMKLVWKVVGASFRTWTISGDRFSELTS